MPRPASSVSLPERYSIVQHVADGGMASVWEARDELLGRSVAVKVLSPAFADDEPAKRRFTREARAAARLSTHPHVVTVYDAGESDGEAYMVMALYPGGTVADRLKAGLVPRDQALDWLEDAASALDLAHAEGVVHRDVKPANLLLDAADRVAVADFGIATAAWETSMTQTGMVLGTLAYLAPEQRTGGAATAASDRYALGLVARELLTGVKPGGAAPAGAVGLPGAAEVVLGRATAEDPEARPASCAELVRELEAALGDSGGQTQPTHVAPARSRAAAVPLGAAGAGAAAAGAGAAAAGAEPAAAGPGAADDAAAAPRTAAHPVAAPRSPRTPNAAAAADDGPPSPSRGLGGRALAGLAALALLLGLGGVLLASGGGDDSSRSAASTPSSTPSSSTTKKRTTSSSSGSTPAPAPSTPATSSSAATPSTPAPASGGGGKSRSALVAQMNRAFAATDGNPAAQVAPLQEAVSGLCTDEGDINCAYALYNLGRALRLSGRPAEAVPLLQRRLSISDYKTGVVKAELAAAQQAANGAPAASSGGGSAKGAKAKDKGKGGDD